MCDNNIVAHDFLSHYFNLWL